MDCVLCGKPIKKAGNSSYFGNGYFAHKCCIREYELKERIFYEEGY